MSISLADRRKKYNIPVTPVVPLTLKIIHIPKVYGYIRVSTKKQEREGCSLEAQKVSIEKYCSDNNLPIPIIIDEGARSGSTIAQRPKFIDMCEIVKEGDTIIAYSLSRLGRNTEEVLHFISDMQNRKIKVISLKEKFDPDTIVGKLMLTIMSSVNEFEMEQSKQRIADTIQRLKEEGKFKTKPHIGWKFVGIGKDRQLVEDPQEQNLINFILSKISEYPDIRNAQITRLINEEIDAGRLTYRKGKHIHNNQVHRIIQYNHLRDGIIPQEIGIDQST